MKKLELVIQGYTASDLDFPDSRASAAVDYRLQGKLSREGPENPQKVNLEISNFPYSFACVSWGPD